MPYRYHDDIATADIAFEAWGATLEELFKTAADAETIRCTETVPCFLENTALDLLLFDFLGELIFHKDAGRLLLRPKELSLTEEDGAWELAAELCGEAIDASRHPLNVDVKAVTLHRFSLEQEPDGTWRAMVVLDI
ncbi:MAG: archease [Geobacter sp.]|nr:archease [Geobacter sp.]